MKFMLRSKLDDEIIESLVVSTPLVIVQLIESVYSLTDVYFVSGLGEEALAGVGIAGYITWLIGVLIAVFQAPIGILTAQLVGAGRLEEASRVAGCIVLVGTIYSLVLSLSIYSIAGLLVAVQSGATGIVYENAVKYLEIRLLGFTLISLAMMLDSIIVSTGKTKLSMIAHTIGVSINIVLDPLLIYGLYGLPRLGVSGAAIATVMASSLTIPVQLIALNKIGLSPRPEFNIEIVRKSMVIGAPVLAERAVIAIGNNAYAGIVARLGEAVMAAHNIGLRIESIVYMPGFAFMMTASTLVGQRVGRGDFESARRIGLKVIHLGAGIMAFIGVAVALTGYYIVAPFSPNQEVRELASTYLLLAGLSELGLGLAIVSSGAIRGAGETRIPFILNATSMLIARVIPAAVLARLTGAIGPWIAMFVDVYVRGLVLYALFRSKFNKLARKLT